MKKVSENQFSGKTHFHTIASCSLRNGKVVRPKPSSNLSAPRKSSYGDYDSELVDGKYITSVPIISMSNHDDDFNSNSNLRWEAAGFWGTLQ